MTTPTLTAFLLARIAEDEAETHRLDANERVERLRLYGDRAKGEVVVAPSRVLGECEAKRRIVELHFETDGGHPEEFPYIADDGRTVWPGCAVCDEGSPRRPYCDTVRILAAIYADHPDHRDEWKP